MIDKKKACPVGGTTEQATETAAYGRAAISCDYFTTDGAERQPLRVSDFLGHGQESAQTMKELRQLLHEDGRKIRLMIQKERRHIPIVADCQHGYWIAANTDEVTAFCRSMRARADEIRWTARSVERAAGIGCREPMPGQCDIWGGGENV